MQTQSEKNVYFVSLGCPKNLVDSQVMLGKLETDQYHITRDPAQADVIIVNTCSFIQASKEESVETILEMAQLKEDGRCRSLVVSGCLAQRYSKQLERDMPEIDLIIGTGQYHRITELLGERRAALKEGRSLPNRTYVDQPAFIHSEKDERIQTGPSYSAYLKLSEGCNRRCTFCIIPKLRGDVRSRSMDSLVVEASNLAASGTKELNLVAQDLTHYGIDNNFQDNLEALLPRLCKIEGLEWIRLHYVYPDQFSDELIEVIAREPKIVKYLDMPIQHTNDQVLRRMGRKLTKKKLFTLIEKLRDRVPSIVFRTSIIVGFPGETEAQFQELCEDLTQLKLDHVGVFSFSKEEDTAAEKLDGQLHANIKRKRLKKLNQILSEQMEKKSKSQIGQIVQVLIEGLSPESDLLLQGRMSTQAQEIDGGILINQIPEGVRVSPGDLVHVELTEFSAPFLVGRVLSGPINHVLH